MTDASAAARTREVLGQWRAQLDELGGTNPLLHFEADSYGQIDLERAHPGGLAQFVSAGVCALSNLVRDPLAYSRAMNVAKRIRSKTAQLETQFGLATCHLAGAVADFEADDFDLKIPVLLWPLQLNQKGDDIEVAITGPARVNPALAPALEVAYGIHLDEAELLATLTTSSELVPIALFNFLNRLTGENTKLEVRRMLVAGNFSLETLAQQREAAALRGSVPDGSVTAALIARDFVFQAQQDSQPPVVVVDADHAQLNVLKKARAGHSFGVETLPGCGYLQTVVNLLANLAAQGKRVLVVAPRRQTLNELSDRLAQAGFAGLLTKSTSTWLDTISAISRNEKSNPDALPSSSSGALANLERSIENYFSSLNRRDTELGVTPAEVLRKLAELAAMPHAPSTKARIPAENLAGLLDRKEALQLLNSAWELGEFKFGPQDTAWYQSRFESPGEVELALATAKRLRNESFPVLSAKLNEFIATVEFKPAETVHEIGQYLRLFVGIRESLDRFNSDVFDRSLTELIVATSPRKVKGQMSGGTRRRLKKLAKEYLRPGMSVTDMSSALTAIEEQRELWHKLSVGLKPPMVPPGINDALVTHQALVTDLEQIQQHLDPLSTEPLLSMLPLAELEAKLASLVEDVEVLENLGDRSMVTKQLRELGLEELVRDLGRLHVSRERLSAELDQAWWQSTLELLIKRDPENLLLSHQQLAEREAAFARADLAQQDETRAALQARLALGWRSALAEFASQASELKALLKSGQANLRDLHRVAPKLTAVLSPALGASPFELASVLPTNLRFDTAVLLDSAGYSPAEALASLVRCSQVIAFGDPAIAEPMGFEVEVKQQPLKNTDAEESVFELVREVFGSEVLRTNHRPDGQLLGDLINRDFYQNRISFEPTADDYFGNRRVHADFVVSGNRVPIKAQVNTESLDAEVERALELVFNHALWHPNDSLILVTASATHADRVRAAVTNGLRTRSHLNEYFQGHGRENFEVITLSDLRHRSADRVIFSVGLGLGFEGELPSDLAQLAEPHLRRTMANVLVSARTELHVVSCIGLSDLAVEDLPEGLVTLKDLLTAAVEVSTPPADSEDADSDPMLEDLALRLRKLGVSVKTNFAPRLPLVASYGKTAMILEADWNLHGDTWSERLRQRPSLLNAHGWLYRRIYSFELFSNPDSLAKNIATELGLAGSSQAGASLDVRPESDSDLSWGDQIPDNDERLRSDKPPHWS